MLAFFKKLWYNNNVLRIWRNWQTRMIQVHVVRAVQVQVLLSAPPSEQALLAPIFLCGSFLFHCSDALRIQVMAFRLRG